VFASRCLSPPHGGGRRRLAAGPLESSMGSACRVGQLASDAFVVQSREHSEKRALFLGGQASKRPAIEAYRLELGDDALAIAGQLDESHAPVVEWDAPDQALGLEPIHECGHVRA